MANGFSYTSSHEWANLGQGAPEVGPLPDAPPRPESIPLPLDSLEYAPTTGVKGCSLLMRPSSVSWRSLFAALREAVANLYNVTYRQNKVNKYTYENVCIVPGGRAGLSRIAAVIGDVYTVKYPSTSAFIHGISSTTRVIKSQTTQLMTKSWVPSGGLSLFPQRKLLLNQQSWFCWIIWLVWTIR